MTDGVLYQQEYLHNANYHACRSDKQKPGIDRAELAAC